MDRALVRAVQQISPQRNAREIVASLTDNQREQIARALRFGVNEVRNVASSLGLAWARYRADENIQDTDRHETWVRRQLDFEAQDRALVLHEKAHSSQNTMEGASESASMVTPVGKKGGGSQETPITPQQPHYGLPDTQTVILPYTQYLSVIPGLLNNYTMTDFSLRMTSVTDILPEALVLPVASAVFARGLYNKVAPTGAGGNWQSTLVDFPATTTAGAPNAERPAWRTFWQKLYQFYTVLGCEYELTFVNSRSTIDATAVIAYGFDTYSTTASGNVFPVGKTMYEMENWKGLRWKSVQGDGDFSQDGNTTTIKGYYKPGQAHRNVNNDEDVKTWTAVGSNPSLAETLRIFIGRGAFSDVDALPINVRCKLRYIVQYKDPVEQLTWPHTGQTQVAISVGNDLLATAS